MESIDKEPWQAQFSIHYGEEKDNNQEVNGMLFNMIPKLIGYFSFQQSKKYPIYHVGYIGDDMLFVISHFYALIEHDKLIVHAAVANIRHNRDHDKLGQFYASIRK